jgi:hypothetical protein
VDLVLLGLASPLRDQRLQLSRDLGELGFGLSQRLTQRQDYPLCLSSFLNRRICSASLMLCSGM